MSVLNPPSSDDETLECPLCMEYLELDDVSFYPCSCGYQVRELEPFASSLEEKSEETTLTQLTW